MCDSPLCHKKFVTNVHSGLHTYICFLEGKLLNTQHTTIRAWNCLIPGAVVGSMLSYLSGAAWRKPIWYRTKMLRARKGENFQKPMTPLCKRRMKSPTCSRSEFPEPKDLDSGPASACNSLVSGFSPVTSFPFCVVSSLASDCWRIW